MWAPKASSVLIVLGVWPQGPMPIGAVSSPVWSFADQKRSQRGWTSMLKDNLAWDAPPFHNNSKSIPFHLGSSGHFFSLGSFRADLTAIARPSACSLFFAVFTFPPRILYHNKLSEPVATVYLKTYLVDMPVFVAYGGYLEPTEWEICLLRLPIPLCFWEQHQCSCKGPPVVHLGIS